MSTFTSSFSSCGGENLVLYPTGVAGEHVAVTSVCALFLIRTCTKKDIAGLRFFRSTVIVETCPSLIGDGTVTSSPKTIGVGVGDGVGVGVGSTAVVVRPQLLHLPQCLGAVSEGDNAPMIANQCWVAGLRPVRVVVIEGSVTC